jgi:methyl-accepting chemotaxis protein
LDKVKNVSLQIKIFGIVLGSFVLTGLGTFLALQIGWGGSLVDKSPTAESLHGGLTNVLIIFTGFGIIGLVVAFWLALLISKTVSAILTRLGKSSDQLQSASRTIANSAQELSTAATEQSSSLQETVSAVDEISAIVRRNTDSAIRSKEHSQQSRAAAEKGQKVVGGMVKAIEDMSSASSEISAQVEANTKELSEITTLIEEISRKTQVINEIVFQTKLLSFNASVEAARAGEYGKGFAVVAEEVGNLARMSGEASKEISSLLQESVKKVNDTVAQTQLRVRAIVETSRKKMELGVSTAAECHTSLEEIMQEVATVDTLVSEIAQSSEEQNLGIQEISRAMTQLGVVTQQNSKIAQDSSVAAEQLAAQSGQVSEAILDLTQVINGVRREPFKNSVSQENEKSQKPKSAKVLAFKTKSSEVPIKPVRPLQEKPFLSKTEHSVVQTKSETPMTVPSANDPRFKE